MSIGLVGRKCGMTRVFTDAGESVPVTLIEASANRVTQVKTDVAIDGTAYATDLPAHAIATYWRQPA